jgi:hypothetical protein
MSAAFVAATEGYMRRTFAVFPSLALNRSCLMKKLPDDLTAMSEAELSEERALRDDNLAPLFQRWPALNRMELGQLRQMYADRLRIARHVGRLLVKRQP